MPVNVFPQITADERRGEGADVDAHVEDGETAVAAMIVGTVERADHGADVRFQQAGSEDDEDEPGVKRAELRDRHGEVSERDHDSAPEDGAALACDAVRDPPARQAGEEYTRGVKAVDGPGFGGGKAQTAVRHRCRHKEDEQCAHPVVAEAFPHFGEEERGEAAGVAEERPVPAGVRGGGLGRGRGGGHG